jgi:uncharacterized protein YciI
MFLLIISYTKSPEEVALHTTTHLTWVKQYIDAGTFVFAGPKKSKLGGAILVKSIDKNTLKAIIAEDSFVKADVAEYQIIDFDCKATVEQFSLLQSM